LIAVTSFGPAGYKLYGKACLESLLRHFPGKVIAYVEEAIPEKDAKLEVRDFYSIPGVSEYLSKLKKKPGTDGVGPDGYDYRFDAYKFCRKVFCQDHVFDEDQYVYWFDGDCVVLKSFPEDFLKSLVVLPFAYLGRNGKDAYTETGWLGFNTRHSDFPLFRSRYLSYFTSGRIFSQLKGWHDCIAFDFARQGINGRNLSPDGHGMGNVLPKTVLGAYMVHNKGDRKFKAAA